MIKFKCRVYFFAALKLSYIHKRRVIINNIQFLLKKDNGNLCFRYYINFKGAFAYSEEQFAEFYDNG